MAGILRYFRRKSVARQPFPDAWRAILRGHTPFYAELSTEERVRFERDLLVFAQEKYFIGAGGLEISDEIRVVISAAAVRLVLHLDLSYYDRLTEIIVYPEAFLPPQEEDAYYGEVPEPTDFHLGESHQWGVVVFSWDDVLAGFEDPEDGHNTAYHEFAHVLDRATGDYDGTPALHRMSDYRTWAQVMAEHFSKLQDGLHGDALDDYGATNEAEFFAVATESFFETPAKLREQAPSLYAELARFYRNDPAGDHPAG